MTAVLTIFLERPHNEVYEGRCVSLRYMQALANNLSFTRYQEVYSAAAEVVGLVLKNIADDKDGVGSSSSPRFC